MQPGSIPDATWIASSNYDFVVYELEHAAFSLTDLRLSLQFMLDRREIAESGSVAPRVTPFVRIPVNGREQSQWIVKQVLDIGVYGIVFPMINTPEDAIAALQAARYIQAADAPDQEPVGVGARAGHGVALLGARPTGVLRPRRCLAARPERGNLADPAVRDDPGGRESSGDS